MQLAKLLTFNARSFILFEAAYKSLGTLVMVPFFFGMLNGCMALRGLKYLGFDNLVQFLTFPLTWVAAIVFLLLAAIYSLIDISATIIFLDLSKRGVKAATLEVACVAVKKAASVVSRENWPFILVVLLVLPLTSFIFVPSFLNYITVP